MLTLVFAPYRQEDHPLLDEIVSLRNHTVLSQGTLEEIAQAVGFRCHKCNEPIDYRQFPVHRKKWIACTIKGREQGEQLCQMFLNNGISGLESSATLNEFCRRKMASCYNCNQASQQNRLPEFLRTNWREGNHNQPAAGTVVHEETVVTTGADTRPASAARSNGSAQVDPPSKATHREKTKNFVLNVKQEPVDEYMEHTSPNAGPQASTSASAAVNGCGHAESGAAPTGTQNGGYQYNLTEEKPLPMSKGEPQRQDEDEIPNRGVNMAHKEVLNRFIMARTRDLVPDHLRRQPQIKTEPQEHDTQPNGINISSQLNQDPAQSSISQPRARSNESHTLIPATSGATSNVSLRSLLIQQAKVAPLDTRDKELPKEARNNNASLGEASAAKETTNITENIATNEAANDNVSQKRPRPVAPPFPRKTKQLEPVMSDSASTTSSAASQSSLVKSWSLESCFATVISEPVRGGNSVTCRVCHKVLKVRQSNDYDYKVKQLVTAHVLKHMKTEAYSCTLCDFESNYDVSVKKHLEKHHSRKDSMEYVDKTKRSEYKEEAQSLLHECFVVLQ